MEWAKRDGNVEGAVVIGSQARDVMQADKWSDLDVMLLVNDVESLLNDVNWLDMLGKVVVPTTT